MERLELLNCDTETLVEVEKIEKEIERTLPIAKIVEIFGTNTYLIGGYIRDVILGKNVSNSDFDLMTRTPLDEVITKLHDLGYSRSNSLKFSDRKYSMKEGTGVINILIDGQEIQVGFVGNQSIDNLISLADINLNCCAFDLGSRKIINLKILDKISHRELEFCSPEIAKDDPMKIISALKQISRLPDLKISEETINIIKESLPLVIEYFRRNPNRRHKLKSLLGNINSKEILNLFDAYNTNDIFEGMELKRSFLKVSDKYRACPIDLLDSIIRNKIADLITSQYGRRLNKNKIFNNKINSVVYELDNKQNVVACCLIDRERIYSVAATNEDLIVNLVSDLCNNNYNVWATVSMSNKHIIDLSVKAGLRLVNDPETMRKILMANYPEYGNRIITKINGSYTTFSKLDSEDIEQVLLLS